MDIRIALAGNPNSGKTTLFNALTGSNQFVGNWPGWLWEGWKSLRPFPRFPQTGFSFSGTYQAKTGSYLEK